MNAPVAATTTMVTTPYMLPTSLSLGQTAYHVNNYVGGQPTWEAFTDSRAQSYQTLRGAAKVDRRFIEPVTYASLSYVNDGSLKKEDSWTEENRIREQTETAERYHDALSQGFTEFTGRIRDISSPSQVQRELKFQDIRLSELPQYVANGLMSDKTASDLVDVLLEKNAVTGLRLSASFFVKPCDVPPHRGIDICFGAGLVGIHWVIWNLLSSLPDGLRFGLSLTAGMATLLVVIPVCISLLAGNEFDRQERDVVTGASSAGALWLAHYEAQHLIENSWLAASVPLVLAALMMGARYVYMGAHHVYNRMSSKKANEQKLRQIQREIDRHRQAASSDTSAPNDSSAEEAALRSELLKQVLRMSRGLKRKPQLLGEAIDKIDRANNEAELREIKEILEGGNGYRDADPVGKLRLVANYEIGSKVRILEPVEVAADPAEDADDDTAATATARAEAEQAAEEADAADLAQQIAS